MHPFMLYVDPNFGKFPDLFLSFGFFLDFHIIFLLKNSFQKMAKFCHKKIIETSIYELAFMRTTIYSVTFSDLFFRRVH